MNKQNRDWLCFYEDRTPVKEGDLIRRCLHGKPFGPVFVVSRMPGGELCADGTELYTLYPGQYCKVNHVPRK